MDLDNLIELGDCPICRGPGIMSHEGGWNVQVECADCSAHTVYVEYNTEEEVETIIKSIHKVVSYLRSISPVWEKIQNGEEVL